LRLTKTNLEIRVKIAKINSAKMYFFHKNMNKCIHLIQRFREVVNCESVMKFVSKATRLGNENIGSVDTNLSMITMCLKLSEYV